MSDRDDIVFWAAWHVMVLGLFRKANLFAKQKFDADKHFTRDSSVLNADCSLTIYVRWSKTIQCWEREIRVTLPALDPQPLTPCQRSANHSALLSISPQRRQPSPCQERCLTRSWRRSPRERVTCQGTVSVVWGGGGLLGTEPKHPGGDYQDHGRLLVDCLHVIPWPVASAGARLLQGRFFPRSPTYI